MAVEAHSPLSLGMYNIINLKDPDLPQDAATRAYVDRRVSYEHTQSVLAKVWTVMHNMGFHPAVHVEDAAGNLIVGSVQYLSDSMLTVSFQVSITGTAHCS